MIPIYINVSAPSEQENNIPVPLWMQKEDKNSPTWEGIRGCAPCPAVFVLLDDPHTVMTEQWQYYLCAINYHMELKNVSALLSAGRAFANKTGFGGPNSPRNFILDTNLGHKPPTLDKVRTCSRAVMTGIPMFEGKYLQVRTFDGKVDPPLKPGKIYPKSPQEAQTRFEDYLYNPRDHRWMFCVANIVNPDGTVVQFPNGGVYDWMDSSPYVWFPHVSNYPVYYDMNELTKVSSIPSPYRRL